ncbi:MAG: DNA replication complex subunit Gins51 [Promethearchaeota archaeon]
MNIKENYEKLYNHWLQEFEQHDLTDLNQEKFREYCLILSEIKNLKIDKADPIKETLLNTYIKNFEFLFNDLLKIRETKIINFALNLKEIDLNKVYEAEKLFYKNLISAIKGFNKIKQLNIVNGQLYDNIETQNEIIPKLEKIGRADTIQQELESKEKEIKYISKEVLDQIVKKPSHKNKYKLIRFIKNSPPLVGIDLINYGPFEKEDIAFIPEVNANILIFEKFAEEINLK